MVGDPHPWSEESFLKRFEERNDPDAFSDAGMQQGMHRTNLQTGEWEEEQTNCSQHSYEYIVGLEMAAWDESQPVEIAMKLCQDHRKAFDLVLRWSYTSPMPDPEKIKRGFKEIYQKLLMSETGPVINTTVDVTDESQGLLIKAVIQPRT